MVIIQEKIKILRKVFLMIDQSIQNLSKLKKMYG